MRFGGRARGAIDRKRAFRDSTGPGSQCVQIESLGSCALKAGNEWRARRAGCLLGSVERKGVDFLKIICVRASLMRAGSLN